MLCKFKTGENKDIVETIVCLPLTLSLKFIFLKTSFDIFIYIDRNIFKTTKYIIRYKVLFLNAYVNISPFRRIYSSFRDKHFLGVVDSPNDANNLSIR